MLVCGLGARLARMPLMTRLLFCGFVATLAQRIASGEPGGYVRRQVERLLGA